MLTIIIAPLPPGDEGRAERLQVKMPSEPLPPKNPSPVHEEPASDPCQKKRGHDRG